MTITLDCGVGLHVDRLCGPRYLTVAQCALLFIII